MVILKPGKELPHDCAFFKCRKCECEWVEYVTKITYSEEVLDEYLLYTRTKYIMKCPNCGEKVANHEIKKIVLENLED